MAEISSTHIMVDKEEVFDSEGMIKTEILPEGTGGGGVLLNLDGGNPASIYEGLTTIDGGGVS